MKASSKITCVENFVMLCIIRPRRGVTSRKLQDCIKVALGFAYYPKESISGEIKSRFWLDCIQYIRVSYDFLWIQSSEGLPHKKLRSAFLLMHSMNVPYQFIWDSNFFSHYSLLIAS